MSHSWDGSESGCTRGCSRCGVLKIGLDARGRWTSYERAVKFEFGFPGVRRAAKIEPPCRPGLRR